jgi:hypothetical protein
MMNLPEIISQHDKLFAAFEAVSQPRSDYQLRKFVVGEHETPERQYLQVVVEMQRKVSALRRAVIERRKKLAAIDKETNPDERELMQIDLDDMNFAITGAMREFDTLYSIYMSLPSFTAKELQDAEENYWQRRLIRQAQVDLDSFGQVGPGNLDALRQAGIITGFEERFAQVSSSLRGVNHEMVRLSGANNVSYLPDHK